MKVGSPFSKKAPKLGLSHVLAEHTLHPQETLQQKAQATAFQLASGLISYKIESLQIPSIIKNTVLNNSYLDEAPSQTISRADKSAEARNLVHKSSRKMNGRFKKRYQVTLKNFEMHLRDYYFKDSGISLEEFYTVARNFYSLLDDQTKQLVNLSRRWCRRFLKRLKGLPGSQTDGEEKMDVEEDDYHVFSEPESAQMEVTMFNSSELWREHTLKLLSLKYSGEKGRAVQNSTEGIMKLNEMEAKTLANRRQAIMKLSNQQRNMDFGKKKQIKERQWSLLKAIE